ncbi:MAG TPA: choice-of-anchor Q domain-containing protein [Solirubrobacteraceae bacterium]|nr:choice-of-anchor Q domain-containing protein [Solirubrobacteraceae bacterium]
MKVLGATFVALVALALPTTAAATTITVNTMTDTTGAGACSLREAISAVNAPGTQVGDCAVASTGADTITLGAGDYQLTIAGADETANQTGDLNVFGTQATVTIAGAGEDVTSIDATSLGDRVLNIATGATATLRDLKLFGGIAPSGQPGATGANSSTGDGGTGGSGGQGENGGGILNAGTLTLDDVTVTSNHAGLGGAGGNGGAATGASGDGGLGGYGGHGGNGGGIYNSGTLTVTDSTISYNNPYEGGSAGPGGNGGFSANSTGGTGGYGAVGGDGGGIYNAGSLTISGSTIDHNNAGFGGDGGDGGAGTPGGAGRAGLDGGEGGGVSSPGTYLSITNTTIADNGAGDGGSGGAGGSSDNDLQSGGNGAAGGDGGDGGGLFVATSLNQGRLLNATVAANQVGPAGNGGEGGGGGSQGLSGSPGSAGVGGALADFGAGTVLQNTVVASNGADNCYGPNVVNGGHDLSYGDASCPDSTGVDPELGALEDNGGPTETMALGSGSAAIDAVPATGADCPATDQRGALRPAGAACDVGAYEVATPSASTGSAGTPTSASDSVTGVAFSPDVAAATAYFQYGPSTAYGADSPHQSVAPTTPAAPVSATLGGLLPGTTYHYRLVVTNGVGTSFGADRTFTTSATPTSKTAPAPGSGRPTIAKLKITPKRFSRKHGATISYTLSESATTTFKVLRPRPGRTRGRTCAKPSRANRHGKRCTRWVAVGRSFTHAAAAGTVRFMLSAALAPGSYRLQATPHAGGLSGNTITTPFAVLAVRRSSR